MLKRIKEILEFGSKVGFWLPAAHDPMSGKASSTLFFSHIAFYLSLVMIISLGIQDLDKGTTAAMIFSGMYITFYLLRNLQKVKLNLESKSIEVEGEDDNETNTVKVKEEQ